MTQAAQQSQPQPASSLMSVYARLPVSFVSGQGVHLFDADGKRYLDALSGIAVCGLGHAHPAVTQAVTHQAKTLLHTSNLYQIEPQARLAEKLCQLSGMDKVFFSNSGSEANETAIKLARLYGHERGFEVPTIVVMDGAFHGRTLAALSASGNRKIQAGFEPLVDGFCRAPFDDVDALEQIAVHRKDVVAVMLEPIIGESGVIVPSPDYLQKVRALCDKQGWLMVLDEVQTGNGRTGHYFAYQGAGALPDVVTTAKGLGNGVPIGACLARGVAANVFKPGNHGSTFGGNLLACAAALATLETLEQEQLIARAAQAGDLLQKALKKHLAGHNLVQEIRGQGLMIGIEMVHTYPGLAMRALNRGLLINVIDDRVIRLLPPLIVSDADCEQIAGIIGEIVAEAHPLEGH